MRKMERMKRGKPWVLLGVVLVSLICRNESLSVTVNEVECLYEYVFHEGDTVSGNFVVVDHDIFWKSVHPGIDFSVTSPQGNTTILELKGKSGYKFEFKAPHSGIYKFCFINPFTTPETVSIYIHVGHIPTEDDVAQDEHLNPLHVKIAELIEALESVTADQKFLKARDAQNRYTNESTRKRVITYAVLEYIMLFVVSGVQAIYIRRLFSHSVAYNRV